MHIFHLSLPFQDHEDPFGLEWIGTLYDDKKYMLSLISATKYDHHRPSLRQGEAPSRRETIERPIGFLNAINDLLIQDDLSMTPTKHGDTPDPTV